MPSAYPNALDTHPTDAYRTMEQGAGPGEGTHAIRHNDLADAINKIEAELGVAPSGSFSSVRARFDVGDADASHLYGAAATRPTTAPTGALFIATDTHVLSRYSGTGWVDLGLLLPMTGQQNYTVANAAAVRTIDANTYTMDDLADVLGTLISDLITAGILV